MLFYYESPVFQKIVARFIVVFGYNQLIYFYGMILCTGSFFLFFLRQNADVKTDFFITLFHGQVLWVY